MTAFNLNITTKARVSTWNAVYMCPQLPSEADAIMNGHTRQQTDVCVLGNILGRVEQMQRLIALNNTNSLRISPCLLLNPPADALLHISHTTRPQRLSHERCRVSEAQVGRNSPEVAALLGLGGVLALTSFRLECVGFKNLWHKPKTCVLCVL